MTIVDLNNTNAVYMGNIEQVTPCNCSPCTICATCAINPFVLGFILFGVSGQQIRTTQLSI